MRSLIFLLFLISGCERALLPGAKILTPEKIVNSIFQKDKKGGIFNNIEWYSYDFETHVIYPHLDVYAIKTPKSTYLIQFQNYYNPLDSKQSGFITLEYSNGIGAKQEKVLDASSCGNTYSNPDFETCIKDPEKNEFIYLDLESGEVWKMSDEQALTEMKWDLGFKNTTIKLNSGTSGPSTVVGALAFRNKFLFEGDGSPNFLKLRAALEGGEASTYFEKVESLGNLNYFPPEGKDRVIFETDWWSPDPANDQEKIPHEDNWWLVRSKEGSSYIKLNIPEFQFLENGDSQITFNYYFQPSGEENFSETLRTWKSPAFANRPGFINICFDFDQGGEVDCKLINTWDLKIAIFNKKNGDKSSSEWRIFNGGGALGTQTFQEVQSIFSGRIFK